MTGLLQDIRYGTRQLRKNPGFAAVCVFTLALGIGASTLIFSLVYNGVLHPFPYRSADRLATIDVENIEKDGRSDHGAFHLDEVAAFRSGNHTYEDILAYGLWYVVYTHSNQTEIVKGVGATPNAMEFWGVPPLLGRGFNDRDVQPGAPPVTLLNYLYWLRHFQGDKDVIGTTMMINGSARIIIGVMPPRFQAVGADMYMPVSWTRVEPARAKFEFSRDDPFYFWATGILKKGISLDTASADIDVIARQEAKIYPDEYPKKFRVTTKKLSDIILSDFKQTLLLLFGAAALVLLISCSNVAGLLLARASARTKEIALRAALGAGRMRLIRQLLSESLLLAGAGCVVGCFLAYAGLKALLAVTQMSAILPMEAAVSLNRPALAFAMLASLFSTVLCGLAPALHAIRTDLQKGLASTGVNVNATFQHSRFRSALAIGQVGLALLLLTCAGLVTRSFFALIHADLGVRPENVFTAEVQFPKGRYDKAEVKRAFFDQLLSKLNTLPGVTSSTELIGLPLLFAPSGDVTIPGKPHREQWTTNIDLVSEGYFQTLGLHLLHGRLLTADDVFSARKVVVVNEKLARKYFPGEDPLGRQIKFNVLEELPETPHDAYFEIVGIVNDTRSYDFEGGAAVLRPPDQTLPQGFIPYSISGFGNRGIAMLTRVPPLSLVKSVREMLWSVDHDLALVAPDIAGENGFSMDKVMLAFVYSRPKFSAITFGACAGLGFALAIVGLFSVMSYIVSLQTHDIGIRLALGAPPALILRMMLKRALLLIGTGIVIGLAASLGVTRFLASQFRGISATDPLTLCGVVITVMAAGLSASFFPARRATQVDPMTTLRNE
jgi:putative ABC transport system permease protein